MIKLDPVVEDDSLQIIVPVTNPDGSAKDMTGATVTAAISIAGVSIPATSAIVGTDPTTLEVIWNKDLLPAGNAIGQITAELDPADRESVRFHFLVTPEIFP